MRSSVLWNATQRMLVVTDFSGQLIQRILKDQAVFTLEDGTDRLFRNVGNYQSALRNSEEDRSSQ
jgi:hypothetical protein